MTESIRNTDPFFGDVHPITIRRRSAVSAAATAKNPPSRAQNQPSNRAFRDRRNRHPETLKKGKKSPFIQ
jgi:hypothetical protein